MSSFIVGLTGQSGSGKTTVCSYFQSAKFGIIDCDKVSRDVAEPETQCLMQLASEFGPTVINNDGTLNRKELGNIVFSSRKKLTRLNSIIFPYITERITKLCNVLEAAGYDIIVLDAPTLFESGAYRMCDAIVSVTAPRDILIERIMRRDSLTNAQAQKRLDSQLDESYLRFQSAFIINNNGDLDSLNKKLERAVCYIRELADEKSS